MHKLKTILLCCALPLLASAADDVTKVALNNPQMTDGDEKPEHWTQTWVGAGKIKMARDTATFHSAPASLALAAVEGAARAQLSQFFDVRGVERIQLSGWLRAEGGATALLALQSFVTDWKGIEAVVARMKAKCPQAKILLLGNTHYFDKGDGQGRQRVRAINAAQARLADGQRIRFLDFSEQLLGAADALNSALYAGDKLHLNAAGYRLWAAALDPVLADMLK